MPRRITSLHQVAFAAAILVGFPAGALRAQSDPLPRWTITGGFTSIHVGTREGWGYGPELSVRRDLGKEWGLELRLALPAFSTNDDAGGGAIDLGPTLTFVTKRAELGISAGATVFLLGDDSELFDGGFGVVVGGHATAWLAGSLGLVAAANLRLGLDGGAYPSLGAGIAVRF